MTKAATHRSSRGEAAHVSVRRLAVLPLILLVRGYQLLIRPFLLGHCKFHPTCSEYAVEALREHGPFGGVGLAVLRILRCHPFGPGGIDPVPPPDNRRPADTPA